MAKTLSLGVVSSSPTWLLELPFADLLITKKKKKSLLEKKEAWSRCDGELVVLHFIPIYSSRC